MKIPENINIPRSEWERLIDEWIFSEKSRRILKKHLLDGMTIEDLADEFHYSKQNIQRIIYKETARLFKKIK